MEDLLKRLINLQKLMEGMAHEETVVEFAPLIKIVKKMKGDIVDSGLMSGYVALPPKYVEYLQSRDLKLGALESGGVDNWDGYSTSLDVIGIV